MAEQKKHTTRYILSGLALVLILTGAIILNNIHEQSGADRITSALDTDNGDLKINWSRFTSYEIELSDTLNITSSGVYHLTGSLTDANIAVNVPDGKIKLILDNVTIKNSTGPAIVCYAADDLVVELVGENTLEDGATYATSYDEDVKGAIYSKDDLTLQGSGTLNLTANYQDGIVGKDDLKINSGTYNIIAADDGIRGKDSVYIVDGTFNITAKGDGIKSTNGTTVGKGFVLIEKGDFTISVGDDGIHAENNLVIQDGTVNIKKSYEGLEARSVVINGGDISIVSSDDGINAGGGSDAATTTVANRQGGMMFDADENCILTINDGNVYVNASGDGIDSNGYLYFNGGTVVVDGPTNNGNGALDSGISIVMNGGTVIAVGASGMAETLGSASSVYNASIYFSSSQSAGTKVEIKNSAGDTIITHTSAKAFNHMSVGTADFKEGETYTIYLNGTKYQTFAISGIVTTVGNTNQNIMPGGGQNRR